MAQVASRSTAGDGVYAQAQQQTQQQSQQQNSQPTQPAASAAGQSSTPSTQPGAAANQTGTPTTQSSVTPSQPAATAGQSNATAALPQKPKDDRIFGVMPNHLTVNGQDVERLTWKGKFAMTAQGAFDPYEFVIVGLVAGIHQADDSDAPFGQGASGYAKRYGAGFADQAIGNMMTGAVYPSLLRTDPRYYRLGEGSFGHRFGYAMSRIVITRTDSGRKVFNAPEFLGNATAAGISNLYYPSEDRTFSNNAETFATQLGIDCFGNFLKEFWPDIHEHLHRKK